MKMIRSVTLLCACALMVMPVQVHAQARGAASTDAALPNELQTLHGFKIEAVAKANRAENGSWISMTKDSKGRLLLGGQRGQSVTRLTIDNGKVAKEEVLKLAVSEAMGMLEVGDALLVNGNGKNPKGETVFGLFRLRDPKGEGFSEVELLREWPKGSGEHGAHALLLAPDKKHIYAVNGNQVPPPDDALPNSPLRNYADDRTIPRQEDTFMANEKPPGGTIVRMDLDGKNPQVVAGGLRNTYDAAINADGEIFGFDSDMEWDWGTPWYRPTRVFHATSGAEFGYRGGSGKYPVYYEDSLPPVVNIGLGSPTGVTFGYGAKYPAKYQKALYVMDWTFGRLMAVHLRPKGASYEATWENFVAPKSLHTQRKVPLNLTDIVVGDDGCLYFTIGGRNTQSCLYRVSYTGEESTATVDARDWEGTNFREIRQKLESFNGKQDRAAVETAWPYLSSDDRFLRFAARLAIESQPVDQWKAKALGEKNPQAAIESLLALARLGGKESNEDVLKGLAKLPLTSLNEEMQLQKLRVMQVAIARNGKPTIDQAEAVITELDPLYPSHSPALNNELSQILLALNAPTALPKTVKLVQSASTIEQQIAGLMYMRYIKVGWTPELRRDYFSWFNDDHATARHPDQLVRWFDEAGRAYANGNSFNGFTNRIRSDALTTLTPEENASEALAGILSAYKAPSPRNRPATAPATNPAPLTAAEINLVARSGSEQAAIPARPVVKDWKMTDIEPTLDAVSSGRSFERGKAAYVATQCAACHAMAGTPAAGGVGPDLTAIASRFRRRDILESVVEPSKTISEQFADTVVKLKSGDVVVGRVLEDSDAKMVFQTNPRAPDKTEVKKSDIESRKFSTLSPMPTGLINILNGDEILDLLAYLEAGGKADHPDFVK